MVFVWFWVIGLAVGATEMLPEKMGGQEPPKWHTGRRLDQQLELGINGDWVDVPVRDLLNSVARSKRIMLFIDRRVDPTRLVTLAANDLTWDQFLLTVSRPHGWGFCRIEDTYYVGPAETAWSLPHHYQQLVQWITKNRDQATVQWKQPVPMNWGRLSQPRELLESMTESKRVQCVGCEKVEFDIWPEYDGAYQPMILKAALLVVGFDNWLQLSKSGEKLKVTDYPESSEVKYLIMRLPDVPGVVPKMRASFPQVKFTTINRTSLRIAAVPAELSPVIAELVSKQRVTATPAAVGRYSANFRGERGSILATLARQLEIKLEAAEELNPVLSETVEFDVNDATADEIIVKTLEGTGLRYKIVAGEKLLIFR